MSTCVEERTVVSLTRFRGNEHRAAFLTGTCSMWVTLPRHCTPRNEIKGRHAADVLITWRIDGVQASVRMCTRLLGKRVRFRSYAKGKDQRKNRIRKEEKKVPVQQSLLEHIRDHTLSLFSPSPSEQQSGFLGKLNQSLRRLSGSCVATGSVTWAIKLIFFLLPAPARAPAFLRPSWLVDWIQQS